MSIIIPEHDSQWRTSGMPLEHTADNLRNVIFQTRSRTLGPALPALYVIHQILLRKLETCRHSVHNHSDKLAMRLTENRHPVFSSECIHNS